MKKRIAFAIAGTGLALLVACGGGGSSVDIPTGPQPVTSPSNGPSVTPTPIQTGTLPTPSPTSLPPTPVPTPVATPTTASTTAPIVSQSGVQTKVISTALSPISSIAMISGPGGLSAIVPSVPAVSANARRGTFLKPFNANPVCNNGSEIKSQAGANGTESYVLRGFYDTGCTKVEYEFDATLISYIDSQSNTAVWGEGLLSYYDNTGTVVALSNVSNIFVGKIAGSTITNLEGTISAKGGLTTAAFGNECQTSGSSMTCGNGLVTNSYVVGNAFGSILASQYPTIGSLSGATVAITGYTGAMNSLTLVGPAATAPYYSVVGGTQSPSITISAQAGQIELTDPANDATTTLTLNSNGSLAGVTVQTSTNKTIATFTADAYGMGSIQFPLTGKTAQIVAYMVI